MTQHAAQYLCCRTAGLKTATRRLRTRRLCLFHGTEGAQVPLGDELLADTHSEASIPAQLQRKCLQEPCDERTTLHQDDRVALLFNDAPPGEACADCDT